MVSRSVVETMMANADHEYAKVFNLGMKLDEQVGQGKGIEEALTPQIIRDMMSSTTATLANIKDALRGVLGMVDQVNSAVINNAGRHYPREISESKAMNSLKLLGSKREEYYDWNVKLINMLARFHKHLNLDDDGANFKDVMMKINQEWSSEQTELTELQIETESVEKMVQVRFRDQGADCDINALSNALSDELDYILTDRTEGEAAARVKKARGKGLQAYYRIHKWFTKTTGPALQEQMKAVVTPTPITKDELMLNQLEEWERMTTSLKKYGKDYDIGDQVKINALEVMMSNKRDVFEAIERTIKADCQVEEELVDLITKLKQYAAKRR